MVERINVVTIFVCPLRDDERETLRSLLDLRSLEHYFDIVLISPKLNHPDYTHRKKLTADLLDCFVTKESEIFDYYGGGWTE